MTQEWPNYQRPFHPTDFPHGMRNYDLDALSSKQKEHLNSMKIEQRRENELYFYKHPEIHGVISILLRHMLMTTPTKNIHEIVGNFFSRPLSVIIKELLEYFEETNSSDVVISNFRKLYEKNEQVS